MFLDLRSVAAERNLMFDKDLLDVLEIAPAALRNGANFGALLVRRLSPAAAKVVNSNSLLPLCWPPAMHTLSRRCKPTMGKLRRMIVRDSHCTTGAWPDKSFLYVCDPAWHRCFDGILGDGDLFPRQLFDYDRVRESWNALLNGDRGFAPDIEKLVQFGIMQKQTDSGLDCLRCGLDEPMPGRSADEATSRQRPLGEDRVLAGIQ
jgi:hypothetical protein